MCFRATVQQNLQEGIYHSFCKWGQRLSFQLIVVLHRQDLCRSAKINIWIASLSWTLWTRVDVYVCIYAGFFKKNVFFLDQPLLQPTSLFITYSSDGNLTHPLQPKRCFICLVSVALNILFSHKIYILTCTDWLNCAECRHPPKPCWPGC